MCNIVDCVYIFFSQFYSIYLIDNCTTHTTQYNTRTQPADHTNRTNTRGVYERKRFYFFFCCDYMTVNLIISQRKPKLGPLIRIFLNPYLPIYWLLNMIPKRPTAIKQILRNHFTKLYDKPMHSLYIYIAYTHNMQVNATERTEFKSFFFLFLCWFVSNVCTQARSNDDWEIAITSNIRLAILREAVYCEALCIWMETKQMLPSTTTKRSNAFDICAAFSRLPKAPMFVFIPLCERNVSRCTHSSVG